MGHGETTCIRGDNAKVWQGIFYFAPLWGTIVLVAVLMSLIVCHFVKQEKSNARWDFRSNMTIISSNPHLTPSLKSSAQTASIPKSRSRSSRRVRETTWQAICYVGSFLLTWTFPTILIINELMVDDIYYHWVFLGALFTPCQGFFNFLVYLQPKVLKRRSEQRQERRKMLATRQHEFVMAVSGTNDNPRNNGESLRWSMAGTSAHGSAPVQVSLPIIVEDETELTTMEPLETTIDDEDFA